MMVNRIICYFFFFDLIFALSICVIWVSNGITPHPIELGSSFTTFINQVSRQLNDFKIQIPIIDKIDYLGNVSSDTPNNPSVWEILTALISQIDWLSRIFNVIIFLTNGLTTLLNFIITFINILIEVLQFLFLVVTNFMNMVKNLADTQPAYPSI